mgnify:CR=1 FL=1
MTEEGCMAILDIGTAKSVALVLRAGHGAQAYVAGSGLSGTAGLHKGKIVDHKALAMSIRTALRQAEDNAGCRAEDILCGVSGTQVRTFINRGATANGKENKIVQQEDVNRAIEASKVLPLDSAQEIIHALPQRFYVDGREVSSLEGMHGLRLEVETAIMTGGQQQLDELAEVINNLGTASLKRWIYGGTAMANTVLTDEERQTTVLLMDIGAGTTEITLCYRQQPYYTMVLPIAGNHITGDLSIGLSIDQNKAEQLKLGFEMAKANVSLRKDSLKANVSQQLISEIIEARLQEIFALIQADILQAGHQIPPYVVLAGGTANLPGMAKRLNALWGSHVRIAMPPSLKGMPVNFYGPEFSSIAALSLFATSLTVPQESSDNRRPTNFFTRISNFWQAFSD